MRIVVGMTGASGAIYGIRLLEALRDRKDCETHLVISKSGKLSIALETDWTIDQVSDLADFVHSDGNLAASIASGSFQTDGMIIVPCSIKTLSGVANSYDDNLLVRAADVALKERRPLVLVVREMPLHVGHCRLLQQAAANGAIIAPPVPAFYTKPKTVADIIDETVGRLLDLLGIPNDLARRWEGPGSLQ